jgi:hypothetical protein
MGWSTTHIGMLALKLMVLAHLPDWFKNWLAVGLASQYCRFS